MITFLFGILILILGCVFYSSYVEKQFQPTDVETPALKINDGLDYVPLSDNKNMLIHLLNIAGLGPILGAIQGILFGPVAFLLIPFGCIFMGCVHDYFAGMLSVRNNGAQITELIRQYLGPNFYKFFIVVISIMLLMLASVFVFTSGDLIAERFFNQDNFLLTNPVVVSIYLAIAIYYILASMFPIDKIIGRFYPFFGFLLIMGTLLILSGFVLKGVNLQNFDITHINQHFKGQHILPMFFMTVSCGLLSGFHSTQATIVSRTIKTEKEGRKVFFLMMALESLIAMIWAAAAMHIYNSGLISQNLFGSVNVINKIADVFINPYLTFVVTFAVVVLPITSGDTALRGLRMIIGEAINKEQSKIQNRLLIMFPITLILAAVIIWAKMNPDSFANVWKYFNFTNQLITVPVFLFSTVYLYKTGKNFFITLLPAIFYIFITTFFILSAPIGINVNYRLSEIIALMAAILSGILFAIKYLKNKKAS